MYCKRGNATVCSTEEAEKRVPENEQYKAPQKRRVEAIGDVAVTIVFLDKKRDCSNQVSSIEETASIAGKVIKKLGVVIASGCCWDGRGSAARL